MLFSFLSFFSFCSADLEVDYPNLPGGITGISKYVELPDYLMYIYKAGVYLGFLVVLISLAVSGFFYVLSPSFETKAKAKDHFSGAISGLLIIVFTYLIINTINPSLTIFKIKTELTPVRSWDPIALSGVSFYEKTDCTPADTSRAAFSIPDLGILKNRINSVSFKQNSLTKTAYISILYDVTNFWGKCQYINPNLSCAKVEPFAASASIHKYGFSGGGGSGVTFYRNSFYNDKGGYLKVSASTIGRRYTGNLSKLQFQEVPEDEKICVRWDENGFCTKKESPTLEGGSISSIKIDGNYIVLLIYMNNATDDPNGPYTFCQEFPTQNDLNKEGPKEMKWSSIRNSGFSPNYVVILPIND